MAPMTKGSNLPYRRLCVELGAEITVSEMTVARRLRTGQVDVNGGRFNLLAPFGGYKKSGIGRELGPHALDEFFQLKAIQR